MVDERKETPEKCAENSSPGFTFWGKLVNLPIVQSTVQVYGNIKQKNVVFGVGFKAFEMGVALASNPVKSMANSVSETYPKQVSAMNGLACSLVDMFQVKFPVVKEPTDKIIKHAKRGAENMLHAGVRRIFRTTPGCQALKGLDYMITWSEERLYNLSSSACVTPLEPKSPEKVSDTTETETSLPKTPSIKEKLVSKSMQTATVPLAVWVGVLKRVKRFLAGLMFGKHRTISCTASPRKHVDVTRRRKVSPKKRLQPRNFIHKALNTMMGAIGISRSDDDDVRLHVLGDQSDDQGSKEKTVKRKHEAVSGSEYESDEEYQLQELLENYNSEEDSDYVPSDYGSTDSLEYKDDDSESETELLKERNELTEDGKTELEKVEEEKVQGTEGSPGKQRRRRRGRKNKKEKETAESKDSENVAKNEETPSQESAQGEQHNQEHQGSGQGEDACPPPHHEQQEHHDHHEHHEHHHHHEHHEHN